MLHKITQDLLRSSNLHKITQEGVDLENNKNQLIKLEGPEGMEILQKYANDLLEETNHIFERLEQIRYIEQQAKDEIEREATQLLFKEQQGKLDGIKFALGQFLYAHQIPKQIKEILEKPEVFRFYCRTCDLLFSLNQLDREDSGDQGYWLKACPHCRAATLEVQEVWRE